MNIIEIKINKNELKRRAEKLMVPLYIKRAYSGYCSICNVAGVSPSSFSEFEMFEVYKIKISFRVYLHCNNRVTYKESTVCFRSVIFNN